MKNLKWILKSNDNGIKHYDLIVNNFVLLRMTVKDDIVIGFPIWLHTVLPEELTLTSKYSGKEYSLAQLEIECLFQ